MRHVVLLSMLLSLVAACGRSRVAPSRVADADDVMTLPVNDASHVAVEGLIQKLKAAREVGAPLKVADLAVIIPLRAEDSGVVDAAYPNALAVTCEGAVCNAAADGESAKARIDSSQDGLSGVDLGLKAHITASFKVSADLRTASLCAVDGVYFSRLIFRKNLKAFQISLHETPAPDDFGSVNVWLAGADDAPTCAE